jgi:hypothetical protein
MMKVSENGLGTSKTVEGVSLHKYRNFDQNLAH